MVLERENNRIVGRNESTVSNGNDHILKRDVGAHGLACRIKMRSYHHRPQPA